MTCSRRGVKEIVGVLLLAATSSGIAQAVEPPVPPAAQKPRIRGIYDDYSDATKLLGQKRYKDALAIFQRIYDTHGDYRDTYGGMIDCVLGLGRRVEAREMYDYFYRTPSGLEDKPWLRYSSTFFAARRGMDYVILLLEDKQVDKARAVLRDIKTEWLRNCRSDFRNNKIPFEEVMLDSTTKESELQFQALIMGGTDAMFHNDGNMAFGEPSAEEALLAAKKLRPDSALAHYLLAMHYLGKHAFDKFEAHMLESAQYVDKPMRPFLELWLDEKKYDRSGSFARVPEKQWKAFLEKLHGWLD